MGAPNNDPFAGIEWARRGDVEVPASWSDGAVRVVASRYLRDGERSVRTLIERIGTTLAGWVVEQGLAGDGYEHELLELLVRQRGAFNSPVWFNVGVDAKPQCSACFILSVEDSLASILELARIEGLIFQKGSGSGTNLSALRSSREAVDGGGHASGPVSFMRGYDAFAGVVKSGGRTRRAAKMQILNADHPDVRDFVRAKALEEKKAKALLDAGFSDGIDGEAYRSVAFQNSNLSVRAPDVFFDAVEADAEWVTRLVKSGAEADRLPARALLREIAESAWACGDPGLQYDGAIQAWNPCPESGRINASNPCSEYLFLDDTACNLASLNLLTFLNDDNTFDIERFVRDVGVLLRAMEAVVDKSSYPTPEIERNSRRFRPLGLGYANLGALLMSLGLPYDSDEARGWAASITALMTGEAYRVSESMAAERGAFEAYDENRDAFLAVLQRHHDAVGAIRGAPEALLAAARQAWSSACAHARRNGVRNAQVTVLAPTGTIAFLMDCDTTGIEPELALVKYKQLVGGDTLKLVNHSIGRALKSLGYPDEAVAAIERHVEKHETIEGAPGLKDADLPVFDTAFGRRTIAAEGHLKMMAAAQPFLSGGISKTINLPESATPEDIERIYVEGWKLGLKAISVFRERSKGVQPVATKCVIFDAHGCCD
ncbi:MAG: vitamin B12-dependent ribonucleotide reductase [Planctomycetota bacterium]|jgi:ribonucleoside-diphosphate reductase alpha chain